MINLKDLTYEELAELVAECGGEKYRTAQIYQWLYRGAESFEDMSNISKGFAEKLKCVSYISVPYPQNKYISADGTVKYLWRLSDGEYVESVVMEYKHGRSICISTQAGCNMGCKFCASTLSGKKRDLTAGEIIDQVVFAIKDSGKISNIVLMGIGEPLDNYDNVIKFLKNVNRAEGLNIGYRHISLSTCGIVPKIYDLAKENMPITLSISLHAPFDELRSSIMPINRKYNISELMKACKDYIKTTGRRISFEYTLINNVNDTEQCAKKLADLIRGMLAHVNLIPVNEARKNMIRSTERNVKRFSEMLSEKGINVTVRRQLGNDIKASCGQLRANARGENDG